MVSPAYTRTFSTQSGFSWRVNGTKRTTYLYMGDQVGGQRPRKSTTSWKIVADSQPVGHELDLGEPQRLAAYGH